MLNAKQFRALFPNCSKAIALEQLPLLNATMLQYGITTKRRIAAFCATLAVESGEFRYRSELASGRAYEGRQDLGNVKPGDGVAMKGHGRIQITGRSNHTAYARYVKKTGHLPYVNFADQKLAKAIAEDPYALDSAGWFWTVLKKLNGFADRGNFLATQIRVNGQNKRTGLPNHWKERKAYYQRALSVLPEEIELPATIVTGPTGAAVVQTEVTVDPAVDQVTSAPATELAPETPEDRNGDVVDSSLLQKATTSETVRSAGKSLLFRAGRPLLALIAALEAGNVIAWLGLIVFVIGAGVVIFYERHVLKRMLLRIVASVKAQSEHLSIIDKS